MAQIICTTTENFVDFITHEVNHDFIENLQYIVFDEVHLPKISNSMYWSKFIPQKAQFLLLSATLGDSARASSILHSISPHHKICLIKHNVRPIALQRVMFKGCDAPISGVKSSNLKAAGRLSCQVNPFDPTARDLRSMSSWDCTNYTREDIPSGRADQNTFGKTVITPEVSERIAKHIDADLDEAVTNPTSENLFNALSYVFSNSLQPALVFNTSSAQTKHIATTLVDHIQRIESRDPDVKRARKIKSAQDKQDKKDRDQGGSAKSYVTRNSRVSSSRVNKKAKSKSKQDNWATEDEPDSKEDTVTEKFSVMVHLNKWKFPTFMEGYHQRSIPFWVQNCLDYGIGVYTRNFPKWLRYKIFDAYKAGEIQVLISDTALSIGINLPARTCILTGDIDGTLYRQMGGRSGRRGFDNQGYVIPMFDKAMIRKCLLQEQTPVDITVPESLSMIDLIRLQTPLFLDMHASEPYTLSKKQVFPQTLKQIIMENYYMTTIDSHRSIIDQQLKLIRAEKWHVHRLTNTIKHLDFTATLIFIQLLITGKLARAHLLPVISTLFGRGKPQSDTETSKLVVPIIDKELRDLIKRYASMFNIDINPDCPIRDYFGDFCNTGKHNVTDLDNIEKIGNWIYVLKRQVIKLAPRSDRFTKSKSNQKLRSHLFIVLHMRSC